MPDLDIMTAYVCATNVRWSKKVTGSKGETYAVSWGPTPTGECQYGWNCTCRSFKFRKTCRHVEDIEKCKERCGWNGILEPTAQPEYVNGEARCPECHGPVEAFRVGV